VSNLNYHKDSLKGQSGRKPRVKPTCIFTFNNKLNDNTTDYLNSYMVIEKHLFNV